MNLAVRYEDDAADRRHVPVMVEEVCGLLSAHGPLAFVDVTVGTGGHAEAMLRASKARMLGLDRDAAAIAVARDRLGEFGDRVVLERADFGEVAAVMKQHHFDGADAILAEVDAGWPAKIIRDEHEGAVSELGVFGVPTFIVGDSAVFVRLMSRPRGDGDLARDTVDRVIGLITDQPDLNEFKYTRISR